MSRVIAIGDVHGCATAFATLLDEIQPTYDDLLVPLGDYIDRGPDSRGVIEQLIGLETKCRLRPLLGNHELMMLAVAEPKAQNRPLSGADLAFWMHCGGDATLDSYGQKLEDIDSEHLSFLNRCHRYFETDDCLFLHANYDPELPLDRQPEKLLFWEHIAPVPPLAHSCGKTAIVGHTPQQSGSPIDFGYLKGIDTYCVGGLWLTAYDVVSGQLWQANEEGKTRAGEWASQQD